MTWSFCVHWVQMRGDSSLSWFWWICSFNWWRKLEYPEKSHRPVVSHWQTLSQNQCWVVFDKTLYDEICRLFAACQSWILWKESLSSNGQQFHQNQLSEQSPLIWTYWTQKDKVIWRWKSSFWLRTEIGMPQITDKFHHTKFYRILLNTDFVIKFVSDLRQVCGFSPGTPVSSTNWKWRLNTIKPNQPTWLEWSKLPN
jgi:hypothetical protein